MKTSRTDAKVANGELYDVGEYVDGRKAGTWRICDARGNLSRTKTHRDAKS